MRYLSRAAQLGLFFFVFFSAVIYAQPPVNYQNWLLTVDFNKESSTDVSLFLEDPQGQLWASASNLQAYGFVNLTHYQSITYEGEIYYRLHDFPGLSYDFYQDQLALSIKAPPGLLKNQAMAFDGFIPNQVAPPTLGGYFNYDTSAQTIWGQNQQQVGGLFTAGIFNHYGVGTENFLVNKQTGQTAQYTRLNTTWQDDFPNKMWTLRLGDTFTATSAFGQSVGFGGIQFGTNFSTQPNFITFPLPSVSGAAVIPTSVNLLVNNNSVSNQKVNPGPFNITNIPVVTGAGTVTAVTTDFLGRQQVVSVPYYASAVSLKKGLSDFSYEAGFIRKNYGTISNDYSQLMTTVTHAYGVTDNFTEQVHAELLAAQQTAGVAGGYILSTLGIVSGALALSHANQGGGGALGSLGFQRQNNTGLSLGSNIQVSSPNFIELGYDPYTFPSLQSQSYIGYPLFGNGSGTLAYTAQQNRGSPNASLVSAAYSQSLPLNWGLTVTALTNVGGGTHNQSIYLTLSRSISDTTFVNLGGNLQPGASQGSVQLTRNLPAGSGYGYSLLAAPGQSSNYQAAFTAQNNIGTYGITAANQDHQTGLRGEVSGGVAAISGGGVHLSREINDSFAVVETGIPNLDVYNYNQIVATTDSKGYALIPDLVPYQDNPLALDANEIPLNAEIKASKMNVIPYYNSGRLVKFPIKISRSAVMQILLSDGHSPLPPGTEVQIEGQADVFPVGENGQLYVSGLKNSTSLIAHLGDQQTCHFTVVYPQTKSLLPDLGPQICLTQGVIS